MQLSWRCALPALLCALLATSCAGSSSTSEPARDEVLSGMTLEEVRTETDRTTDPLRRRPVVAIVLGGGGLRVARAMGADIVVAVDIYCHSPRYPATSIMSIVLRTTQVQSCLIAQNELAEADVLIAPAVSPAGAQDAAGRERARQAGYDAARSAAPQLEALLRQRHSVLRSAPNAPISNATLR